MKYMLSGELGTCHFPYDWFEVANNNLIKTNIRLLFCLHYLNRKLLISRFFLLMHVIIIIV